MSKRNIVEDWGSSDSDIETEIDLMIFLLELSEDCWISFLEKVFLFGLWKIFIMSVIWGCY
jgi:hypothetical protein